MEGPPSQRARDRGAAYPDSSSRRMEPQPRFRAPSYERYREPPPQRPPRVVLEDVMGEISALQDTITQMSARQPEKTEVIGLFHDLEASFKKELAHYYPAEVIDAKLAERTQIIKTVRDEVATLQQKVDTEKQSMRQDILNLKKHEWGIWEKRAVVAFSIFTGGIFVIALIIDFTKLALGVH